MNADVTLPFWALAVVVALAAWTVAVRLILPALRWFVAGRSTVVLEECRVAPAHRGAPFHAPAASAHPRLL